MGPVIMENASLYVALSAFVLNMIGTIVGVTWKLSRVEVSLRETIVHERKEIDRDIEQQSREFGETVAAVRSKVHEVEVWTRDNFVRRDEWHQAMNQMQERWASGEKAGDERWLRLETKVDRIFERIMADK